MNPAPAEPSPASRFWTPRRIARLALVLPPLLVLLYALWIVLRFTGESAPAYDDGEMHFKYGSIGTEAGGGVPLWIWKAIPALFEEETERTGYSRFGLIFEPGADGNDRELPVGLSVRVVHLVRDLRAVVKSLLCAGWGTEDPAEFARNWKESKLNLHDALRNRRGYLLLAYEELVRDLQGRASPCLRAAGACLRRGHA